MSDGDMELVIARLRTPPPVRERAELDPNELERIRAAEELARANYDRAVEERLERKRLLQQTIGSFLVAMAREDYPGARIVTIYKNAKEPSGLFGRRTTDVRREYIAAGWSVAENRFIYKHKPYHIDPGSEQIWATRELFLLVNGDLVLQEYPEDVAGPSYLRNPIIRLTGDNNVEIGQDLERQIPSSLTRIAQENNVDWSSPALAE